MPNDDILQLKTVGEFISEIEKRHLSLKERMRLFRQCSFSKKEINEERKRNPLVRQRIKESMARTNRSFIQFTSNFKNQWEPEFFRKFENREQSIRAISIGLQVPYIEVANKYAKYKREISSMSIDEIIEKEKRRLEVKRIKEGLHENKSSVL